MLCHPIADAAPALTEVLGGIEQLPPDWHRAGSVSMRVLEAIVRHANGTDVVRSAETGAGKTTLLFSHLSRNHKVFALDGDNGSVSVVRNSPLLRTATVEFVEGPTQRTLPSYTFDDPLQVALIDGPHGYPFPELEYLCLYPHLTEGALLILDDIHIPTIRRLFEFLSEEEMFRLIEVVDHAAFFRRTAAPVFDPEGDGWWLQQYNRSRFQPPQQSGHGNFRRRISALLPGSVKRRLRRVLMTGSLTYLR